MPPLRVGNAFTMFSSIDHMFANQNAMWTTSHILHELIDKSQIDAAQMWSAHEVAFVAKSVTVVRSFHPFHQLLIAVTAITLYPCSGWYPCSRWLETVYVYSLLIRCELTFTSKGYHSIGKYANYNVSAPVSPSQSSFWRMNATSFPMATDNNNWINLYRT